MRSQLLRKSILGGNSPSPYITSFKGLKGPGRFSFATQNELALQPPGPPFDASSKGTIRQVSLAPRIPPGFENSAMCAKFQAQDEREVFATRSNQYAVGGKRGIMTTTSESRREDSEEARARVHALPHERLPNPETRDSDGVRPHAIPSVHFSNPGLSSSSIAIPEPVRTRSPRPLPPPPQDTCSSNSPGTLTREIHCFPLAHYQKETPRRKTTQRTFVINN